MDTKEMVEKAKPEIAKKVAENLLKEKSVGYLDVGISRFTSRKLLVWLTATGFLVQGYIPPGDWLLVSLLWIGVQGALDFYKIRATVTDNSR